MYKRALCLLLAALTAFSLTPAALAEAETEQPEQTEQPEPSSPPVDGWHVYDNYIYYYLNGVPATGWQTITERLFYFLPSGRRAKGWTRIDGETYYFGEDGAYYAGLRYIRQSGKVYLFSPEGVLQRDTTVTLHGEEYEVNEKGVVVDYHTEVCAAAAGVLDQVGWDLRSAFDWAAGLTYFDRSNRAPDGSVHSEWYAMYGFANGYGNCYVMAAVFYQMAWLLGYEVYFIEGGVGSTTGAVIDHSWTELVIGGETFVFDPDFTNETGIDGYQIWYDKDDTWWYFDPVRVD